LHHFDKEQDPDPHFSEFKFDADSREKRDADPQKSDADPQARYRYVPEKKLDKEHV
jgi:hypothetical protein